MSSLLKNAARLLSRALLPTAALLAAPAAHAQYPEHAVTIVVPFNTGTTPDLVTRLLAAEMGKSTGGNFVVLNRVGASGMIGTASVANADPDGYTIGFANVATMAINQSLYKKLPYDADKQLTPVALTGSVQNVLAVRPGLNVKSVDELIAMAKKAPGKLVVASGGNGTTGHLSAAMFMSMAGIELMHVPYKGGVEADLAVLRGEADLVFENISSIASFIDQKKVVPLAVTGAARDPILPELPTLDELGLKGYQAVAWTGYVAPAGTDPKILDFLNGAMNKALASQEVQDKLKAMAYVPHVGPRQALFDRAHKERPVWAQVIRQANVNVD
ncbi:Bug family tripartite tricarboxylate transporter substrate binding protein [Bordetella genomosp. 13]|uniref:Bug family tripartite tricarboxylate transporter substrate binding protein n=1 Tax=Bordetella genomosp. 13 TaxID=463040 RepID=UPI00119CA7F8|nr:tripartite tricarboxylate transporter substrate binding protein [Bordetella genomosp. 13]